MADQDPVPAPTYPAAPTYNPDVSALAQRLIDTQRQGDQPASVPQPAIPPVPPTTIEGPKWWHYVLTGALGGPGAAMGLYNQYRNLDLQAGMQQQATQISNLYQAMRSQGQDEAAQMFLSRAAQSASNNPMVYQMVQKELPDVAARLRGQRESRIASMVPSMIAGGIPTSADVTPQGGTMTTPEGAGYDITKLARPGPTMPMDFATRAAMIGRLGLPPALTDELIKRSQQDKPMNVGGQLLSWDPVTSQMVPAGSVPEQKEIGGRMATITPTFLPPGAAPTPPNIVFGPAVPSTLSLKDIDDGVKTAAQATGVPLTTLVDRYNAGDADAVTAMRHLAVLGKDIQAGALSGLTAELATKMGLPLNLAFIKAKDPSGNTMDMLLKNTRNEMEKRSYGQAYQSGLAGAAVDAIQPFAMKPFNGHEVYDAASGQRYPTTMLDPRTGQPRPVTRVDVVTSPNSRFLPAKEAEQYDNLQASLANLSTLSGIIQQNPSLVGKGVGGEFWERAKLWFGKDSPSALIQSMGLGDIAQISAMAGKRITAFEVRLLEPSRVELRDDPSLAQRKIAVRTMILKNIADRYMSRPATFGEAQLQQAAQTGQPGIQTGPGVTATITPRGR